MELLRQRSRFVFSTMADGSQSSSQTHDMNIAMLAKSVTTLQKQFQQICDALSGKLGNDSDDFSDNEGGNSDSDGRSESGSQVNYHKGTADQSCPGTSATGLGGGDATFHSSTTGTPVAEGQRQRKQRCPASLRTPLADYASRSQPPPENNATVQRACGDEGAHAQGSSDHANSSGTCRDARSASGSGNSDCHVTGTPRGMSRPHDAKGSDNSDCHVTGTPRGTSRPHDATGSDNSDCHVTGTLRGTSRPHITDSTCGGPVLLSDATTVSEKTGSTSAQLEDIFRQHTPATAKAPAVHDYVAKLVSNYRQGVDLPRKKRKKKKRGFLFQGITDLCNEKTSDE